MFWLLVLPELAATTQPIGYASGLDSKHCQLTEAVTTISSSQ
jgi:hypothetical protein